MYAVIVKFLGPTNTKGSRLKATTHNATVTVSVDHSLNWDQQAEKVARLALAKAGSGWAEEPLSVWSNPLGGWVVVPDVHSPVC
jgi:hypothetical protein